MPIYRDVSDGLAPPGIEYYLPLFFDATATCSTTCPPDTVLRCRRRSRRRARRAWAAIAERYEERRHDIERPVLAPRRAVPGARGARRPARRARRASILGDAAGSTARPAPISTSRPREAPALRIDLRRDEPLAPLRGAPDRASRAACCSRRIRPGGARCCSSCCARTA